MQKPSQNAKEINSIFYLIDYKEDIQDIAFKESL